MAGPLVIPPPPPPPGGPQPTQKISDIIGTFRPVKVTKMDPETPEFYPTRSNGFSSSNSPNPKPR